MLADYTSAPVGDTAAPVGDAPAPVRDIAARVASSQVAQHHAAHDLDVAQICGT